MWLNRFWEARQMYVTDLDWVYEMIEKLVPNKEEAYGNDGLLISMRNQLVVETGWQPKMKCCERSRSGVRVKYI